MALTRRGRRAVAVAAVLVATLAGVALVLNALRSNLSFFYTPTQVHGGEAPHGRAFRVGGLVKAGSLSRDGAQARFVVTDLRQDLVVRYTGILPDLFREGRGAVVEGRLDDGGELQATRVLARHDENYMPPEAARALARAGGPAAASAAEGGR